MTWYEETISGKKYYARKMRTEIIVLVETEGLEYGMPRVLSLQEAVSRVASKSLSDAFGETPKREAVKP